MKKQEEREGGREDAQGRHAGQVGGARGQMNVPADGGQ